MCVRMCVYVCACESRICDVSVCVHVHVHVCVCVHGTMHTWYNGMHGVHTSIHGTYIHTYMCMHQGIHVTLEPFPSSENDGYGTAAR